MSKMPKLLQAKHLPDQLVFGAIADLLGDEYFTIDNGRLAQRLEIPYKVVLAKMRSMLRRGLVEGCPCGCGGNWKVTQKGQEVSIQTSTSLGRAQADCCVIWMLQRPEGYAALGVPTESFRWGVIDEGYRNDKMGAPQAIVLRNVRQLMEKVPTCWRFLWSVPRVFEDHDAVVSWLVDETGAEEIPTVDAMELEVLGMEEPLGRWARVLQSSILEIPRQRIPPPP